MSKLILLIVLSFHGCFASINHYLKMPKTDASGHDIDYIQCGQG